MLAIILLFIVVALYLYHRYIKYGRKGKLLFKIPGPITYPVLGNIFTLFLVDSTDIWPLFEVFNKKFFPIYRIAGLHLGAVIIQHPDDIETFLSSPKYIEKSFVYRYLEAWLQSGLLMSKGKKWVHRRKLLTPAFHYNILPKYAEVMSEHGQKLVNSLRDENNNKSAKINLIPFFTKHTLSIICESAMGTPLNESGGERTKRYLKAVSEVGATAVYRFMNIWNVFFLNNFTFYYFTRTGWALRKTVNFLHSFSTRIINERKKYHEETNGQYLKEFDISSENSEKKELDDNVPRIKRRRMAMLDILISAQRKNEINDEGIREEVDTFIFEGHDTSAMALTFATYLLAENTEIQVQARKEVDEIWDAVDGKIGSNEVSKMFYLERCIKESLRLFPSVPFVSRTLTEDLQLKDYLVPKGCDALVFIHDIHRDDHFWPDPLRFDPDRFLPEEIAKRHPFCYIPFSAGPRNCIGQKFALMELKMISAYILRHFYLETTGRHHDIKRKLDIITRPEEDLYVTFTPRNL